MVCIAIEARRKNPIKMQSGGSFEAVVPTPPTPPIKNASPNLAVHRPLCVDSLYRESFMCIGISQHSSTRLKEGKKCLYFWSHYAAMQTVLEKGGVFIAD